MNKYNVRKAAVLLMAVTIAEKILGFLRETVIASQFGATGLTDSYIAGYLIPNFIMVLLNAGLVNVYAPVFLEEWNADHEKAWKKINSISTFIMLLLMVIVGVSIVFIPFIVKVLYSGFNSDRLNATVWISRVFFIGVFIYCISIIEGSILNCFRHFIYPAISIALLSLGIIAGVILFGKKLSINSIAYGFLAGAVTGVILQYIKIKRTGGKIGFNFTPYPDFYRKFIGLLFPVLIATSMSQINVFVDRIFASYLPEGSISYITYADKVTQLPIVIFSGIIATVIFPDLIEQINSGGYSKLKVYFNRAIVITIMFLVPSYVGLTVLHNEIIKLLFERNAFDGVAVKNTASALVYLNPTIIFYGCIAVVSKVYYSLKDTATLMYISIITIVLNVVFDYILMKPMLHNGLVLSTSIISVMQFASSYLLLQRKVDIFMGIKSLKSLLKIIVSSVIMGISIFIIKYFLKSFHAGSIAVISISVGALVYLVLLIVFKVNEIYELLDKMNFHIRRGRIEGKNSGS